MSETTYNLCVYCGPAAPVLEGVRVVDVTPASLDPDEVARAVADSGLTPADFRSRAVYLTDAPQEIALATYAVVCGFAARYLDLIAAGQTLNTTPYGASHAVPPKPIRTPAHLFVSTVARPDLDALVLSRTTTAHDGSLIHHATRVTIVPSESLADTARSLLALAALRRRGAAERFPGLLGPVPSPTEVPAEVALDAEIADVPAGAPTAEHHPSLPGGFIDLEDLRRRGSALRRSTRPDTTGRLAPVVEASARLARLERVSQYPVEVILDRLGARSGPDTPQLWHCPRPERHTHGDANPSMRVEEGHVRCFRCDPEPVDALDLVIDALGATADEAADWIESDRRRERLHPALTGA